MGYSARSIAAFLDARYVAARRNQSGRRRGVDEEVSEKSLRNQANQGFLAWAEDPRGRKGALPLERMRKRWRAGHSGVYSFVAGQAKWKSRFKGLILLKVKSGQSLYGSKPGWGMHGLCALALGVLLLFTAGTWPQQPAQSTWQGVLRNAAAVPIVGAKVRLTGKGAAAEVLTGADGAFRLTPLPVGQYSLTVLAKGRRVNYTQPIALEPSTPTVALTLSDRGELTVALLQAQSATGGEELSSQAVSELPLNKRDFSTLLLLAAGTMTDANGATNFTAQFAINGQRGVEAVFAMDGADISDPEMGGATFSNFNVDAVQEIQSSSGWMAAEIGRGAAGFTNIIARSGASGFRGSFFEFVRNSAFDARNYFDHATPAYPGRIPPFRRNEFGFTNGGPVLIPHIYGGGKRTFYFTQYQGFRQVLGTTQVLPVPSAAQRPTTGSNIVHDLVNFSDGTTDTLDIRTPGRPL